jgi:hypothetical protein
MCRYNWQLRECLHRLLIAEHAEHGDLAQQTQNHRILDNRIDVVLASVEQALPKGDGRGKQVLRERLIPVRQSSPMHPHG